MTLPGPASSTSVDGQSSEVIEGYAYLPWMRFAGMALAIALCFWMVWLLASGRFGASVWSNPLFGWSLAALVVIVPLAWQLRVSKVRVDSEGIEQTWLWPKKVAHRDLVHAKLIQVPGLTWLFVPRLYTRGQGLKMVTFYCGDPAIAKRAQLIVDQTIARYLSGR